MTIRGHQLGADWSRHGTYANAAEDLTTPGAWYVDDTDITITWGRGEARATEDAIVGKLTASLNNQSRTFSPENTASPIAGKVLPGVPMRYQVTNPATAATGTLFGGVLDEFEVDSTTLTFTAVARDWAWNDDDPTTGDLSTPVYSGQRTDYLIGVILDAIGWTGPRDLDPGATVVDWWWAEGEDAWTAINRLVDSEGPPAIAFIEGGTFVFRNRHHRLLDTNAITSQGTFTHRIPATGFGADFKILAGSMTYDHGLKYIANSVNMQIDQRQPGDVAPVWSSDTPITLAANETQTLIVQANDPFINAIAPAADAGDYDLAMGALTATISRTSGRSLVLTLTAGGTATVVNSIRIRGNPLPIVRTYRVVAEDTSSVGTFGRKSWPGTAPWANRYDARAIADKVVAVYAQPRPTVTLSIAGIDAAHLTRILNTRVSDRITIRNDELGLNRDFHVETITHTITKLGVLHKLTVGCQVVDPVRGSNEFTFDVAGKGFNDGVFAVEGLDVAGALFQFDVAGHGFNDGRFGA